MTLLILGLLLWIGGHVLKRVAPEARARMGSAGKGVAAAVILLGLVLIVLGYRAAPWVDVYYPAPWGIHINNLLMLIAVGLFGLGSSRSPLRSKMRHPMLTGTLLWAIAHLIVNGDLASLILFGTIGLWAIAEMIVINRAEPVWHPYQNGTTAGTIRLVVISLVVFVVIAAVHTWLGVWPFPM